MNALAECQSNSKMDHFLLATDRLASLLERHQGKTKVLPQDCECASYSFDSWIKKSLSSNSKGLVVPPRWTEKQVPT